MPKCLNDLHHDKKWIRSMVVELRLGHDQDHGHDEIDRI